MRYRIITILVISFLLLSHCAYGDEVLEKVITKSFDVSEVELLRVDNLAGKILIEGSNNDKIKVEAIINSEKSSGLSAEEVADLLDLEIQLKGERLQIIPQYPLDEFRSYSYPPGKGSFFGGRSEFRIDGRKIKVVMGRKGKGLRLWVDIRITLPEGVRCGLRNRVGDIKLDHVNSECIIKDCASANVNVNNQVGDLQVDTGSGDITIMSCDGFLDVDTGSGDVKIDGLRGDLRADTGSGDVTVRDANGEELYVDTGSGEVGLRNIDYPRLHVDTGSGEITVDSTHGLVDRWVLDTGSGDVTLLIPDDASFRLDVDTGSGDVDCNFDDARIRTSHGEIRSITVGDGEGQIEVDTGSGDVFIRKS
ncbi:MAG: DUF4097 domain-containing protein [bacterium]|nr:DUF4097 domain-containing protein [bacterium]